MATACTLDFSGSAPQTRGIINSPLTSTISAALGAVALLLGGGDIPVNDGIYRPIDIHVPRGSFLNPSRPVAVRARNNPCNRVYNVVMRALAPVMPDMVMSAGNDTTNAIGMGHLSEDAYRVYMEVVGGGWGACSRGRRRGCGRCAHLQLQQHPGRVAGGGVSLHADRGVWPAARIGRCGTTGAAAWACGASTASWTTASPSTVTPTAPHRALGPVRRPGGAPIPLSDRTRRRV